MTRSAGDTEKIECRGRADSGSVDFGLGNQLQHQTPAEAASVQADSIGVDIGKRADVFDHRESIVDTSHHALG